MTPITFEPVTFQRHRYLAITKKESIRLFSVPVTTNPLCSGIWVRTRRLPDTLQAINDPQK
jgi:hypothetical protein